MSESPEIPDALRENFAEILMDWRCLLIEFNGAADPVHLLVSIHPALNISALIHYLKSASTRRMRNRFANHLAKFYGKPYFWHRARRALGSRKLPRIPVFRSDDTKLLSHKEISGRSHCRSHPTRFLSNYASSLLDYI
ncbi:MAG: transposase [Firmicutes bacterium]|nr:transposase [Bacillota bacterium]